MKERSGTRRREKRVRREQDGEEYMRRRRRRRRGRKAFVKKLEDKGKEAVEKMKANEEG